MLARHVIHNIKILLTSIKLMYFRFAEFSIFFVCDES